MTLFIYYDGADVGNSAVRLRTGNDPGISGLTSAADGSVSFGGVVVDDPASTLTITGWRPFSVEEPDCTQPRLFTGYVADRRIIRGPFRTQLGRQYDTTIVDQNAVLHLRIITGADGKRPAETQIQRIDWLLGSSYLSGLIADYGFVARGTALNYDAADYRGQYADDVLNDLAAPIYQLFFAYWDATNHGIGLFFNSPIATISDSTLKISNVLADVDNSITFYPLIDGEMTRDPSEVYSTIRYVYATGVIVGKNATTASTFIERGVNFETSRIRSAASAQDKVNKLLVRDSVEQDTIKCTLYLPTTKVGLLDAGQRVQVKFSHLPGYTAFTWTRVTRRVVAQVEGTPELYEVQLELSVKGLSGGGGGGPPVDHFPSPPPGPTGLCDATHTYTPADTFNALGSGTSDSRGNIVYVGAGFPASTNYPDPGHVGGWAFPIYGGGTDYAGDCAVNVLRFAVIGPGIATVQTATYTAPRTMTAELHRSDTGALLSTQTGASGTNFSFVVPDDGICGHYIAITDDGSTCGGKWGFVKATFTPKPTTAPQPGQPVTDEFVANGNGVTTTFTTQFPFASGSLKVYVDRLDQTAAITAQDGTTGSFTLGFAPKAGELVEVSYQGI